MNNIFKKIYALLNGIYRKQSEKKNSYSLGGVDLLVNYLFRNKKLGVYIDVGCNHPIKNNNTYLLHKRGWSGINIDLDYPKDDNLNLNCDYEQISRTIFNLIKNSIESIQEKAQNIGNFDKKINIAIKRINHYIAINIFDNGIGFTNNTKKELIKPYYTTKKKGTGLGLAIVTKIISDHNSTILFNSIKYGAKVEIIIPR